MAESDLAPLGDFKLYPKWAPASEYVTKIRALKALAPPLIHEIRHDGKVVFRVYYTEDNAYTRGIIQLLPAAYRVNREMLDSDMIETPVFIFKEYADFNAFYRLFYGQPPGSWVSASGKAGALFFSQFDVHGQQKYVNPRSVGFRAVVAHEFNHCLVLRITGATRPAKWMLEGLAEVAGSRLAPEKLALNDRIMAQLFAAGKILAFSDLNNFKDIIEGNSNAKQQGIPVPDPYAQGYDMTRFFLHSIESGALPKFLTEVRDSRDFAKTFQKYSGKTLEEFYNAWLQTLAQKN